MPEQQITIDGQIIGILTIPDNATPSSNAKLPAVLMLHGFGTNKDEINDFYKNMAALLEKNNIISLRIDFREHGHGTGKTRNFSVDEMVSDAARAFQYLISLAVDQSRLGVIGFSLGAAVSLMLSQQVAIKSLALISPALDLTKDFTGFLGPDIIAQLAACNDFVNVDLGWRKIDISKAFYESLRSCKPRSGATTFNGHLLCMAGKNDFSAKNAKTIIEAAPASKKY